MRMTRNLLMVLALVLGHTSRVASQQTTGSPRQRMTLELLRAMNARDTVALRRFVAEHFVTSGPGVPTPEVRVGRLLAIRTNLGALEFQRADTGGANEYVALVQNRRTEEWSRFALVFEETAVNILFIEPRLNLVSTVFFAPKSLLASPNAAR
jgi:hypothetical protein